MGAVDDLRKLLQDVVTPDLKAIDVRLTAVEKRLDGRIDVLDKKVDALDKKIDSRADALDRKVEATRLQLKEEMRAHQDAVMAEIRHLLYQMNSNHAAIQHSLDIDRRLERIESGMQGDRGSKLERTS